MIAFVTDFRLGIETSSQSQLIELICCILAILDYNRESFSLLTGGFVPAISSKLVLLLAAFLFVLTACGGDDTSSDGGQPTVVVTTNILGDVVRQVAGDQVNVETIMPAGADPHVFQASAQQVDLMMKADLLISNGEDFEERLARRLGLG